MQVERLPFGEEWRTGEQRVAGGGMRGRLRFPRSQPLAPARRAVAWRGGRNVTGSLVLFSNPQLPESHRMTTLDSADPAAVEPPRLEEARVARATKRKVVAQPAAAKRSWRFAGLAALLAGLALVGWNAIHFFGHTGSATAPAISPAAPVPVGVYTAWSQTLRLWNDFSGRLRAVDSADIRPEVGGRITEVRFHDGQSVRAGEVLLVIEPLPYEAAEARAQARLASAKAALQLAAANQQRNVGLLRTRVISQSDFDTTESANAAAAANVLAAEADLKTARVDLDHAYVKAPIAGRVSRAELTVGNLVQSGAGAPLLTSVVSEDGIYADFEVDEQTYLETIRDAANGNTQEATIPVEVTTPGEAGRTYKGFVQNFDNRLDPASGTIRVRARFSNPDRSLVPGMFVSVRLASSRERGLILVPERAVGYDQSKKFVFAVTSDNKAAYREVELGRALGGQRVVLKGLQSGERVVVDGLQRIRAKAVVAPKEVTSADNQGGRPPETAQ